VGAAPLNVPVEEITVSGAAPTAISWQLKSGALRYDVARGNVANLAPGVGTVDLGTVVCIENDSPNVDTVGSEDVVNPLAGEAFFYLWRGTQGKNIGPGSYGTSTAGDERTASAGDCAN
ncbi:MAG: hypothetical protein OEQ13_11890, partial [Acidobacteriota bacterium]|nr:hypothetical protein [Acidobacteriota bacterium]